VSLLGTGYTVREAAAADEPRLKRFLDNAAGEKLRDFHYVLDRLAEGRPRSHQLLYADPADESIALLGASMRSNVLEASALRLRPSALQTSLAAQMVARLRGLAAESAATAIRVTDAHPHPLLSEALLADGFRITTDGMVALTSPALCPVADLHSIVERCCENLTANERAALAPLLQAAQDLAASPTPALVVSLERQMRPLRLVDGDIDSWLVPIKPAFSTQLFNAPPQLFDRSPELGISIEHVYYRGGRSGEAAPARVLWYVSKPDKTVIGCSDLIEVIDDQPDVLYRRFRRLGVYNREQVRKTANDRNTVRALHVINTEVFRQPVPYSRLRALAATNCQRLQLVSASRINQGLFSDIMKEARRG
jgi:predicted transcriptional regulator